MKDFYITFGQEHAHIIQDKVLNENNVLHIQANDFEGARIKAFKLFGNKWCMIRPREEITQEFFPGGIIEIEEEP